MVDFKPFVGVITLECCCWNKLLTAKATCWIAWDTLSCMMIIFSFYKFFVAMDGISANGFFQASAFFKAIMGSVLEFFLQLWFACNMCQFLLEYLLNLVTFDYMLLIMVCIVYHDVFVGRAVVFDWVGQASEFAVWQHLFCILY